MNPITARCDCSELHVALANRPLFVHACHCLDCKRRTGSSFGITCIVLATDIEVVHGTLRWTQVNVRRHVGQCPACGTVVCKTSTRYPGTAWLQANCIEDLRLLDIGAHTWVCRKDDWLQLPEGVPQFAEGYERDGVWPEESLRRLRHALDGGAQAGADA